MTIEPAEASIDVHLIDGTYELFRHFFAVPSATDAEGNEVGALRGVLGSVLYLLEEGATHVGVATDHVIESFRNDLWPGYKTSEGVAPELLRQFHPLEDALKALGVRVWPMVELEADDALAAGAATAAADPAVRRVFICTPDKDLSQCVEGDRVVMLDRRSGNVRDEAGVIERFGVPPSSIPDWLGLVGDSSDGYPGIAGWGEKSAGRVLARYRHLESIPKAVKDWEVDVRGAARLAESLFGNWEAALLFRHLATVRSSAPVLGSVAELAWQGPLPQLEAIAMKLDAEAILRRVQALAQRRGVLTS